MAAKEQIKGLFDQFKQYYPNSQDTFEPTLENLNRWRWAVVDFERRNSVEYQDYKVDPRRVISAQKLASSRAVGSFDRLPLFMRTKFEELASLFPGRNVWATGSRIDGTYIDQTSGIVIKRMREALLKKDTPESDYDIIVDLGVPPVLAPDDIRKKLPAWADLVVNPIPEDPKILIPMWDFSKLPEEKHGEVLSLYERRAWGQLMAIHNEFKLSATFYCCEVDAVRRWFTWAIEREIIVRKNEDNPEKP